MISNLKKYYNVNKKIKCLFCNEILFVSDKIYGLYVADCCVCQTMLLFNKSKNNFYKIDSIQFASGLIEYFKEKYDILHYDNIENTLSIFVQNITNEIKEENMIKLYSFDKLFFNFQDIVDEMHKNEFKNKLEKLSLLF